MPPLREVPYLCGFSKKRLTLDCILNLRWSTFSFRKILFFRSLLAERKAMKENAPMTDRLMAKALALHVE